MESLLVTGKLSVLVVGQDILNATNEVGLHEMMKINLKNKICAKSMSTCVRIDFIFLIMFCRLVLNALF